MNAPRHRNLRHLLLTAVAILSALISVAISPSALANHNASELLILPAATGSYSPAKLRLQETRHERHAARWLAQRNRISRDEAARIARRQHGGKVLAVRTVRSDDGRIFYRVKLIRDGRVRIVRISAN